MDIGKKFPIIVSVFTGIVTIIYSFGADFQALKTLRSLIIIMVTSFILSSILKIYLDKKVFYEDESENAGDIADEETLEGADYLHDGDTADFAADTDNLEDDSLMDEESGVYLSHSEDE